MEYLIVAASEGRNISKSSVFFFGFIGLVFFVAGVSFLVASNGISSALQAATPRVSYGPAAKEGFPGPGFIRLFGAIFSMVGAVVLAFALYYLIR
ncbi:hypothetical protein RKD27_002355 [Streptomyces sp. SAI-126]|uniref:hypothetical protein n=1 Tax=Streptomyces sp. SAI-126 TaxID=3377732 RepID=UPI003C7A49BD